MGRESSIKAFFLYFIFGIAQFLFDTGLFGVLLFFDLFPAPIANGISRGGAALMGFTLNHLITFKRTGPADVWGRGVRFVIWWCLITITGSVLLLGAGHWLSGVNQVTLFKVGMEFCFVGFNFVAYKFWIYKHEK